jgi:uncharacterized membrane-anchored protein
MVLGERGMVSGERGAVSRVATPTVVFWALKLLTTGLGESASDFLVKRLEPLIVVPVAVVVLAVALVLQLRRGRYRPLAYWSVVLLVGIVGTMAADVAHVVLGVPYPVSTVVFAAATAGILALWWATERDVSVHDVVTPRRELYYWAAVCTTFALGTAAGDLTATTLPVGYFGSILGFAAALLAVGLLFRTGVLAPVLAFWLAYVLTRPLGASVADWLAVPVSRGGVGVGSGPVTAAGLLLFAAAVALVERRSGRAPVVAEVG